MERINTYEKFLKQEGLPVIRDYYVPDVMAVSLKPWQRKGGLGAYINLIGAEGKTDAYLCEIPPGKSLLPQRHLYEEMIYVLSGYGATSVWVEGGKKQSFEWQEGSLFSPPLNTWHQHFNGQSNEPVRYIGVTRAPVYMNLFHDLDFIFNNDNILKNRYSGEEDYFNSRGKLVEDKFYADAKVWESNFIPDCRKFELADEGEEGMGAITVAYFELAHNVMGAHVSQQPGGSYKKAHYHRGGAHLLCLGGQGYELMWPIEGGIMADGVERIKIDLRKNSLFSPPERWFHQHFSAGSEPLIFLAFHDERSHRYKGIGKEYRGEKRGNFKLGGTQIEYEDEDPKIRRLFREELTKTGASWLMHKYFPGE